MQKCGENDGKIHQSVKNGDKDRAHRDKVQANERNKAPRQKQWKENYQVCRDSSFAAQEPSKSRGRVLSRVRFTLRSALAQVCLFLTSFVDRFVTFVFIHISAFFPCCHSILYFALAFLFFYFHFHFAWLFYYFLVSIPLGCISLYLCAAYFDSLFSALLSIAFPFVDIRALLEPCWRIHTQKVKLFHYM